MKYTYEELIEDLKTGHEVEFSFLGKRYSISHNNEGWYLTKFEDVNDQAFNNYLELLEGATINSLRLIDIWDKVEEISIF